MTYSPLNGIVGHLRPPDGVTYSETPDGFELIVSARRPLEGLILIAALLFIAVAPKDRGGVFPFILVVLLLVGILAMMLAGHIRVRLANGELSIFTGVGRVGWNRRYRWTCFHTVEELYVSGKGGGYYVALDGAKHVRFGKILDEDRRVFVIQVLERELARTKAEVDG